MIDLANIELVIFDCDGVLVDSERISQSIMAELTTLWGYPCTTEEARRLYMGHSLTKCLQIMREDLLIPAPDEFLAFYDQKIAAAFQEGLLAVPGIHAVLQNLSLKKCVASNGRLDKMQINLAKAGLLPFFAPHIYSAEQVSRPKPAPDLFLFAAQQFQIHPKKCLVIEDSAHGVRAAKAAGMRVWGFCDTSAPETLAAAGADVLFYSMAELQMWLTP